MSYLSAPTPSILHRHRRKQSLGAKESSESQYLGDLFYWEHKAAVKAAAEERLRMSLYKSPGQVPSYREEVLSAEGQREELKAAAKRVAAELEARFQEEQLSRLNASPEVERPWTIPALSISPQAADSARRRQHAAAARLNRSLFAEGARHRSEEQEREKAAARSATLQEDGFFNRGASSEKWIAPEHRIRHVNVPAVRASSMPWLAQSPAAPEHRIRHVDVPAVRASSMPWLAQSPAAPEHRMRHVNEPAGRASSMPWLAQSPAATPTTARELKPVRRQRDNEHLRVHSRPLWAWDAEPVQKSRR